MDLHVHAAFGGSNSCCAAVSHGSLEHINARRVNALAPGATKTDLISQQILLGTQCLASLSSETRRCLESVTSSIPIQQITTVKNRNSLIQYVSSRRKSVAHRYP